MGKIETALAPLLVGSWCNCLLLAFVLSAAWRYATTYRADSWTIKSTVATMVLLDFVSTVGCCIFVYLYLVQNWGNPLYLLKQCWALALIAISNGCSAFVLHAFLALRIWRLSKKPLLMVALLLLALVSIAALGACIAAAIIVLRDPFQYERSLLQEPLTMWLAFGAGADIGLASCLIYLLNDARKTLRGFQESVVHGPIIRLIRGAIETGGINSIFSIIVFSLYRSDLSGSLGVGFVMCLGRICTLTLVYNLNLRKPTTMGIGTLNGAEAAIASSSDTGHRGCPRRKSHNGRGGPALDVIVITEEHMEIDDARLHTVTLKDDKDGARFDKPQAREGYYSFPLEMDICRQTV